MEAGTKPSEVFNRWLRDYAAGTAPPLIMATLPLYPITDEDVANFERAMREKAGKTKSA